VPELIKLDFYPIPIAHACLSSIAVCPADPEAVALGVPAPGAFEDRPQPVERDFVAILASEAPAVNPLVMIALGAARAEQLIIREICQAQVTNAEIRIDDALLRDQVYPASVAHASPS
jgi:hypothetical protein